jgi:hypothetical protein
MSDITEALEQDAIAETLIAPLHSTYESQDTGTEYRYADGQEGVDYGQQEQPAEDGQEIGEQDGEIAEATPEQREAFAQELQHWDALPQEQQAQRADEHLQDAYGEAFETITPQRATNFTNEFGKTHWGIDNLAERIEPQAFAPFAEVWTDNASRTISLHPHGEQFLEAISDDRRQAEALQIAQSMCDPTMARRYYEHFAGLLGNDLLQGHTPLSFAAKSLCDYARMENLGQQQQQRQSWRRSPSGSRFQTNGDIFDNETEDRCRML